MEISDYQAAASLLGLPSEISSDTFAYVTPNACMVYETFSQIEQDTQKSLDRLLQHLNDQQDQQEMQLEREQAAVSALRNNANDAFIVLDDTDVDLDNDIDDDDNYIDDNDAMEGAVNESKTDRSDHARQDHTPVLAVMEAAQTVTAIPDSPYNWDDILEGLGKVPIYTIDVVNEKKIRQPVPVQAHYTQRGSGLRLMSQTEYYALVKIHARRKGNGAATARRSQKKKAQTRVSVSRQLRASCMPCPVPRFKTTHAHFLR